MAQETIDQLIINKPYDEPQEYWRYDRESRSFSRQPGRRPAGYLKASRNWRVFDDPGIFVEIPLVNQIRQRVKAWREAGYPSVTAVTKRLLDYWTDPEEYDIRRFFFCQLEAAETLIWLAEAGEKDKVGLDILGDGGDFRRLCAKMATGTGKTLVMAMVIAWHVLNKVTYSQDTRFSRNVLVVAPRPHSEEPPCRPGAFRGGKFLRRIQDRAAGPDGQTPSGQGQGAQLARV